MPGNLAQHGGVTSNGSAQGTSALCNLCRQFVDDMLLFDFKRQDSYPERWVRESWSEDSLPQNKSRWGEGFRHHESLSDLSESAEACPMCHAIFELLSPMPQAMLEGWLGLYPWAPKVIPSYRKRSFIGAFSGSLLEHYWTGFMAKELPQVLNICSRHPWKYDETFGSKRPEGLFRAVPKDNLLPREFDVMRAWLTNCSDNHQNCAGRGIEGNILPTRVLDIGTSDTEALTLYIPEKKKSPYVVLSHCWGGNIPGKTTTLNEKDRRHGMSLEGLPQNFQDAIQITRELGFRYLWIDAICIVQDSKEDWQREAAKMASVYAGATLMLSALEAKSSTVGILKAPAAPIVTIGEDLAIQKSLQTFPEYLVSCPLNRRGWCMQERLLAPRILHFGKQQMFWECQTCWIYEDGRLDTNEDTWDGVAGRFSGLRLKMTAKTGPEWGTWYRLMEEYSGRDLTVLSDKLPALSGAAEAFKEARHEGTYVAGLWKDDIKRGIHWGAHVINNAINRKVAPYQMDKCAVLSRPAQRRAPSWSWTALDGKIDFFENSTHGMFEVLDVKMTIGDDDLTEAHPQGTLTLRGSMAAMSYHPPKAGYDVGKLILEPYDDLQDISKTMSGCVLDVDREEPCRCWVITAKADYTDEPGYGVYRQCLVLKEREDGCFERIGFCTGHMCRILSKDFVERTITVV